MYTAGLKKNLELLLCTLKWERIIPIQILKKAPKPKKVVKGETSTDEKKVDTNVSKRKDYHKHHYSPVPGSMSLIKRIPPHLKFVHKLDPTSKEHKDLLSKVRGPVKESRMRPYNERPRYMRDETRRDKTLKKKAMQVIL